LEADFGGRLYVDPMNWDLLRRECNALFLKYSYKANLGTFDTAIVASVKLAGGTRFLSFDATARSLASAEGIGIFPALEPAERRLLAQLKR
jgi:predicted nucleic acid-binding protein